MTLALPCGLRIEKTSLTESDASLAKTITSDRCQNLSAALQ